MSRLCVVASVCVIVGACASADPSGGLSGEPVASNFPRERSRCPPGEVLACEVKSPNRVSDGRYGFRKRSNKHCSCQPERDVVVFDEGVLPSDQR